MGFLKYPLWLLSLSLTPLSLGVGLIVGFFFLPRSLRKIPRTALSGIFFSFFASSSSYPVFADGKENIGECSHMFGKVKNRQANRERENPDE